MVDAPFRAARARRPPENKKEDAPPMGVGTPSFSTDSVSIGAKRPFVKRKFFSGRTSVLHRRSRRTLSSDSRSTIQYARGCGYARSSSSSSRCTWPHAVYAERSLHWYILPLKSLGNGLLHSHNQTYVRYTVDITCNRAVKFMRKNAAFWWKMQGKRWIPDERACRIARSWAGKADLQRRDLIPSAKGPPGNPIVPPGQATGDCLTSGGAAGVAGQAQTKRRSQTC